MTPVLATTATVTLKIFIKAPYVPLPWFVSGTYAGGDGRDFEQSGTSRITQGVTFDTSTYSYTLNGPTAGLSTILGTSFEVTNSAYADTSSCHTSVNEYADYLDIEFNGNPSNPTVSFAPGITYDFHIYYDKTSGSFYVHSADHDAYPSYEILSTPTGTLYEWTETTLTSLFPSDLGNLLAFFGFSAPYHMQVGYTGAIPLMQQSVELDDSFFGQNGAVLVGAPYPTIYQDPNGDWHSWNGN
jgi:hypothetical protein